MKKIILLVFVAICVAFGTEDLGVNQSDSNANQSADSSESTANDAQNPALINAIKSAVEKRFLDYYKNYNITISNLEIVPVIERNLAKYTMEKIIFDDRDLRKESGNFEVHIRHNERKNACFSTFK